MGAVVARHSYDVACSIHQTGAFPLDRARPRESGPTMSRVLVALLLLLLLLGALAVALAAGLFLRLERGPVPERPLGQAERAGEGAMARTLPRETPAAAGEAEQGFLYGRVTTGDDRVYEGRLRFGGDEEAFWDDTFDAPKGDNPWATQVPPAQLVERRAVTLFGSELELGEQRVDLSRPFLARFGDIARIEARGTLIRVRLKNGSEFVLDRMGSDDLGDGLRVWDVRGEGVDLSEREIRVIEFLPTARLTEAPERLHGTVRTKQGEAFTGFIQWEGAKGLAADELRGLHEGEEVALRFEGIASIRPDGDRGAARSLREAVLALGRGERPGAHVMLRDGSELALSGTRDVGDGNRGVFVEDPRYGRVRVFWNALESVTFGSPDPTGPTGPAYDDFPPGRPLDGSVATRDGRHLSGSLVFDLDESMTTDTLDAPSRGVHYTIPFGLVRRIARGEEGSPATVTLHGGEGIALEAVGDLGAGHLGMLVFPEDGAPPSYVPWRDVYALTFARPPAMVPPIGSP